MKVSSCTIIQSPGVYVLSTNVIDSSATTCIYIISSDVVFDGAGYTIDGIGTRFSYGVSAIMVSNVTVKNVVITDWFYGIYYQDTRKGVIENNTASLNNYGIFLSSSSHNIIANNTASLNNDTGILLGVYLHPSDNNTVANNNASSNQYGITLDDGSDNIIANNTASSNKYGVYLSSSSYNIIANNNASSNNKTGILFHFSGGNAIYNNFFTNWNNFDFGGTFYSNHWNTSKQAGTNTIGGSWIGGNFWATPNGTGFSQICNDTNSDGICDSAYTLASGNVDHLPLTVADTIPPNITFTSPTPANNSTVSVNYIYVNVSISDAKSNIGPVILNWNGTNYTMAKSMSGKSIYAYYNKISLSDGTYSYKVYANDSAGNWNMSETRIVRIDATPPAKPLPSKGLCGPSAIMLFVVFSLIVYGLYKNCRGG